MVDPFQNYKHWRIRVRREFPTSAKGSFLRYETKDVETFKDVIRSLSTLDPLARSLAITDLSCHNGIKKRQILDWCEELTAEMRGGDR